MIKIKQLVEEVKEIQAEVSKQQETMKQIINDVRSLKSNQSKFQKYIKDRNIKQEKK